jgi:lipopolysaccharide transport protein LptA
MKRIIACLAIVLVAALAPLPSFGEKDYLMDLGVSDKPIKITSKKFTARNIPGGKEAVFEGKVEVTQGNLTLNCDRMVIVYDEKKAKNVKASQGKRLPRGLQTVSGIRSITGSGNVKLTQEDRSATADKMEFDNRKRTITLTGGPPRLWQGPDVMIADTIIIYIDENRTEAIPAKGKRKGVSKEDPVIRVIIHPDKVTGEKKSPKKEN